MTNVMVAAYAVGDIPDLKEAFSSQFETKKIYMPNEENTKFYRKMYGLQNQLVKNDMKVAFETLERMR